MPKRPTDPNEHAALTVALATGQVSDQDEPKGRQLGGIASASKLTPEQRRERAKKAAAARWQCKASRKEAARV
ncbi:MAG: histone H1 [Gammaproteobacteria bacterium]|nr:histone H1 [Gammaproteobacteria bacterium]